MHDAAKMHVPSPPFNAMEGEMEYIPIIFIGHGHPFSISSCIIFIDIEKWLEKISLITFIALPYHNPVACVDEGFYTVIVHIPLSVSFVEIAQETKMKPVIIIENENVPIVYSIAMSQSPCTKDIVRPVPPKRVFL